MAHLAHRSWEKVGNVLRRRDALGSKDPCLYWDNGKENGNYYSILGEYWDNGKENGNYYRTVVGAFKLNLDPVQSNAPHKCPEVSKHVPSSRQKLFRNTRGMNYM